MRAVVIAIVGAGVLAAQDTSATLSGEISGPGGAAVGALNVELTLAEPPQTTFSLRLNDEGKFEFRVLPPGTYTLTVAQLGFRTLKVKSILVASAEQQILPPLSVEVAGSCGSGGPTLEYLELLPTKQHVGNLSGHVERDEAHPIARATVKLFCEERKVCGETKTNPNGEFIFFNLPPRGDITIRVTRPGFYSAEGTGYEVREGFNSTYAPFVLNSTLRPKPPLVICE